MIGSKTDKLVAKDDGMNISARVKRLEETAQALVILLRQETEAVKGVDIKVFGQLQNIKNDLYEIYKADIQALLAHKTELKDLPQPTKENLHRLERDLSVVRIENMTVLDRASRGLSRLRERIVHVARDTMLRRTSQYGANGALAIRSNKAISTGVSERV